MICFYDVYLENKFYVTDLKSIPGDPGAFREPWGWPGPLFGPPDVNFLFHIMYLTFKFLIKDSF